MLKKECLTGRSLEPMLDLCTFDFECAFVEYEKKKHELSMLTQNKHYL